jgi:hypothetical protein
MKKTFAAFAALISFSAAFTGAAHATQGTSLAYPQVVDSVVEFCTAQEAAKGRCKKGQPVLRVTVRVPECWSLRPSAAKGGVAFAYVMVSKRNCVIAGAAPKTKRYLVAL